MHKSSLEKSRYINKAKIIGKKSWPIISIYICLLVNHWGQREWFEATISPSLPFQPGGFSGKFAKIWVDLHLGGPEKPEKTSQCVIGQIIATSHDLTP